MLSTFNYPESIPIIAASAFGDKPHFEEFMKAGASEYVQKPIVNKKILYLI